MVGDVDCRGRACALPRNDKWWEKFAMTKGGAVRNDMGGVADSCLVSSPSGSCIMYAPANTQYTDLLGIYNFTAACPLE